MSYIFGIKFGESGYTQNKLISTFNNLLIIFFYGFYNEVVLVLSVRRYNLNPLQYLRILSSLLAFGKFSHQGTCTTTQRKICYFNFPNYEYAAEYERAREEYERKVVTRCAFLRLLLCCIHDFHSDIRKLLGENCQVLFTLLKTFRWYFFSLVQISRYLLFSSGFVRTEPPSARHDGI